jgi:DNA-binding transcriptional ArsR family regulator
MSVSFLEVRDGVREGVEDIRIPTCAVKILRSLLTCDFKVTYRRRVDDDAVFRALADPTRRLLLDSLRDRDGQSVNELCARVPGMTRFGVMKHLAVLEQANLVVAHRSGRTKLHFLNPVPIQEIADRWVSRFAAPITTALVGLRDELESARSPA